MTSKICILPHILTLLLFAVLPVNAQEQTQSREDRAAIENAHRLYYSRQYLEAIEAYQTILKTVLSKATKDEIRMNMGQCYAKRGDDALAIQTFQAVIEDDPNGSYATQATHQIGNLFVRRYQYKEAILACSKLAAAYPETRTSALAEYLIATYFHAQGKRELATEGYRRFLEDYPAAPHSISAIYNLIVLYTEAKKYADAEALIRNQLRKNPKDNDMMEKLGDLYKTQGKHEEALNLYTAALAHAPDDVSLREKLGGLYAEKGQLEQAIEEWTRIIENNPAGANRYRQAAEIYTAHRMYDKAIESYKQAIKLDPHSAYLCAQLAGVYKIQGKINLAVGTCLEGLRKVEIGYHGREILIEEIADIYEGEQRERLLEQVIAQVKDYVTRDPRNPKFVLALAELYFYHNRYNLALEQFRRLPQLYAVDRGTILQKYAILLQRAEHPAAAEFFRAIIDIFPASGVARNSRIRLARLYERAGQPREAIDVLTNMKGVHLDAEARSVLAHLWLHGVHDVDAAMPIYQALANQPLPAAGRTEAQLGVAECYLLQGQYDLARESLERIVSGRVHLRPAAQKFIGDSYLFQGDFEKATAEYKKVLDLSPSDESSNDALDRMILIQSNSDYVNVPLDGYVRGLKANLNGKLEEALRICRETIEAFPEALIVDDTWLLMGEIHKSQRRYGDAIAAYEKVVTEGSLTAAEGLNEIAVVYHRGLRDTKKALQTYRQLVRDYPESVIVPYARQQVDALAKLQPN